MKHEALYSVRDIAEICKVSDYIVRKAADDMEVKGLTPSDLERLGFKETGFSKRLCNFRKRKVFFKSHDAIKIITKIKMERKK